MGEVLIDKSLPPSIVSGNDKLQLFIGKLPPPLPIKKERALLIRNYFGDAEAADLLLVHNTRYAIRVAVQSYNYLTRKPPSFTIDDVISAGIEGLEVAIRRYDPTKWETKLISYATFWIYQRIQLLFDRFYRSGDMGIRLIKFLRAKNKAHQTFLRENPNLSRFATREELYEIMGRVHNTRPQTLETLEAIGGANNNDIYIYDNLFDSSGEGEAGIYADTNLQDSAPLADETLLQKELRERVCGVVEELPAREKKIVKMHFGMDGERQQTLEEIGQVFGITRERVRQIKDKALARVQPKLKGVG